ncbi:MAG: hypothetical protein WCP20_14050 [Desulfuromonadales bacterium]
MVRNRHSGYAHAVRAIIIKGACLGLLSAGFTTCLANAEDNTMQLSHPRLLSAQKGLAAPSTVVAQPVPAHHPERPDFGREQSSHEARHVAEWVVDSGDNHGMPFAIVDKKDAKVFVFYANGQIHGSAPVLLGLALGDDAVPGIGDRKLSSIRPEERTTPAGRFVASMGHNLRGSEILWVDYNGGVSMHRVVTNNPRERRLQRLASPSPLDRRISYGCINVPAKFFDNVVRTTFARTKGVVYVLPETKSARELFGSYSVTEHARPPDTGQ